MSATQDLMDRVRELRAEVTELRRRLALSEADALMWASLVSELDGGADHVHLPDGAPTAAPRPEYVERLREENRSLMQTVRRVLRAEPVTER